MKHRPIRRHVNHSAIVRYTATPAITAAHQQDGLVTLERSETDLTLALGADRRSEVVEAMVDRATVELGIEKRTIQRANARAQRIESFLASCDAE